MAESSYACNMCTYTTLSFNQYCSHLVRFHKNDPRFLVICEYENCGFSTKKWEQYRVHVCRSHKKIQAEAVQVESNWPPMQPNDIIEISEGRTSEESSDLLVAAYLLKLETCHRLPDTAIQAIVDNTELLIQHELVNTKTKIKTIFENAGLNPAVLDEEMNLKKPIFSNFCSSYRRNQFYKSNCRLVVPDEIVLGTTTRKVKGHVKVVKDCGYVISLESTLKSILELPEMQTYLQNPHSSVDENIQRDICDGVYVKSHSLFSKDPSALQIILNTDELEIVNPLGTKTKKHKVTMFYMTLGNIPPELRSKLSSIYLVAIAASRHLKKHGINGILRDFIRTVKQLSTNGIVFDVNGKEQSIKGDLVMVPADTPAAAWLGGFKEGVGFANKPCRTCTISSKLMKVKFKDKEFNLRTKEEHAHQCRVLSDETLTKAAHSFWSKEWGVNKQSCLNELKSFDLCKCLVHDPMHVLLEGVIPLELALFLNYIVYEQKWVSLTWLNDKLAIFPYSYLEVKNKPERLERKHIVIDVKVKQTSACMLTLCSVFPFIIGEKIPEGDSKWQLLLVLLQIAHLVMMPVCSSETPNDLRLLIETHHTQFKKEYPNAGITPKMHYMCHFPCQLEMFGPGRHHWCMRFEAKHSFFTSVKWKNFKNLPKSMAMRHQKWICYQMLSTGNSMKPIDFFYSGDICKEGKEIRVAQLDKSIQQTINHSASLRNVDSVYRSGSVTIHGVEFLPGSALLLGYDLEHLPQFVWLENIFIHEQKKHFLVKSMAVLDINEHLNSYKVRINDEFQLVTYTDLYVGIPLCVRMYDGNHYITDKYGQVGTQLFYS